MASIWRVVFFRLAILTVVLAGGEAIAAARQMRAFSPADYLYLPPLSAAERIETKELFPILRYRSFPPSLRALMQRSDIELNRCIFWPSLESAMGRRACNMWRRARVKLEAHGWCWGGSWILAEQHWLPCAQDPFYFEGALMGEGDMFSAADIQEARTRR